MFSYSTPNRVSEASKRPLSLVPNEIYCQIFDLVDSFPQRRRKATLSSLALVCKLFCAMVIPRVYGSLRLNIDEAVKPHMEFSRALARGNKPALHLAKYVSRYDLATTNQNTEDGSRQWTSSFVNLCIKSLSCFSNLLELKLSGIKLGHKRLAAICQLRRLSSLSIIQCDFDDEELDFGPRAAFKLTSLELSAWKASSPPKSFLKEILSESVEKLQISNYLFAETVLTDISRLPCRELCIEVDISRTADGICELFDAVHTITSLTIIPKSLHNPTPLDVPGSALPNLKAISCPLILLPEFLRGRSVERITIDPAVTTNANLDKALSSYAHRITHLTIPSTMYSDIEPVFTLRNLQLLRLTACNSIAQPTLETINRLCENKRIHPNISVLQLDTWCPWMIDLPLQLHIILEKLCDSFPNLVEAELVRNIYWQRESRTHTEWALQPARDAECLRKQLLETEGYTVERLGDARLINLID